MKLYDLKAGTNPRRVRIFLAEKGVTVPTVAIDMMKGENRTPEFLALNPLGTLPVLELDDGTILTESIAICRYFEELHPEPNLFGRDALERAQVEMWNRRAEIELLAPVTQHFVHSSPFWQGRRKQVPEYAPLVREQALAAMAWLDRELDDRPYLAGNHYTVADITAQSALLLGKNTGIALAGDHKNLGRWWIEVSARPTARA
ncbi:glutathione S-transferase family protein [Desertibaculum subflavum]|uniref:glutathione S-transferase family protein n=1 Tax=Desertibaculum subflavum TaxID=2268458 RepID=UPI000E66D968